MADPKKGTGKKPKGSGRRLYTDENPKDTVKIKFATPADARATVAKVKKVKKLYEEPKKEVNNYKKLDRVSIGDTINKGSHDNNILNVSQQCITRNKRNYANFWKLQQ